MSADQQVPHELLCGSPPASPQDIFNALDALSIKHSTINHPPMRTVDDSRAHRNGVPGGYSKNLFLRNKKGAMVLLTLCEDRMVDLKAFGSTLAMGKPSFASHQRLMHYLGVIPGAVTPLAVINDKSKQVKVVLDAVLLQKDPLHFHPCDNSMTTTLSSADLLKFIREYHSEPMLIDFDKA